jgi:hypothetical protein
MGYYLMTDSLSILSRPGIKCFPGNTKLYRSAEEEQEKFTGSTKEEILLTGESVYCICSHHVEQHCTVDDQYSHCHGSNEQCNCEEFRTHSIRLSYSNCYKMVTERLADDFEVLEGYQTQSMG